MTKFRENISVGIEAVKIDTDIDSKQVTKIVQVTSAPASRCHCPPSLDAEAVRPALVEPIPVVITDLKVINNIFIDRVRINYIQNNYLTSNTFYRTTSGDLKSGIGAQNRTRS